MVPYFPTTKYTIVIYRHAFAKYANTAIPIALLWGFSFMTFFLSKQSNELNLGLLINSIILLGFFVFIPTMRKEIPQSQTGFGWLDYDLIYCMLSTLCPTIYELLLNKEVNHLEYYRGGLGLTSGLLCCIPFCFSDGNFLIYLSRVKGYSKPPINAKVSGGDFDPSDYTNQKMIELVNKFKPKNSF